MSWIYLWNNFNDMYKKEITLRHNEIPAKVNLDTGEVIEMVPKANTLKEGMSVFKGYKHFHICNHGLSNLIKTGIFPNFKRIHSV